MTPINKLTKVLANGSDASIKMYIRTYGRECQIYYPQDTGIYSGHESDVTYNKDPDEVMKLFIPNLFNKASRIPAMGHYDLLGRSEYYMIVPTSLRLPLFTKIVATSHELGVARFIIRNDDYASTFEGSVFMRVDLETVFDSSQDNPILAGLRIQTNHEGEIDNSLATGSNKVPEFKYFLDEGGDSYHD